MKRLRSIALILLTWMSQASAAECVLPYSAFGPQALAYKWLGKEWFQWEAHGDSHPRDYPIQVVVYWDQTLEETQTRYPVDPKRELDYRYLS